MDNKIDEALERFAKWTIANVEHGIYIPLPSPETKAALEQLFKEEWLRMIGEDKPELSVGNGFEGEFEAAYRVKVQNRLRAELRKLVGEL
jgi:hypothetical protein